MAKENEPTTRFRVDISELKAGIQEANRQIRLANSEFKAASSGMDNWQKSADGLSAKVTQLGTVLDAQKKKLSSLEEQYRAVSEEQGENSKGAQELLIKINNQKTAVNNAESELKKYEQKLEDCKNGTGEFAREQEEAVTASDRLKKTIAGQETEIESLKRAYQNAALEQGKNSDEAEELAGKIKTLCGELDENKKALQETAYETDDLNDALEDAEDSAKKAGDGFSSMKGALSTLIADGIKSAITGLKELATESGAAFARFQAATGKTADEMEELQEVISGLYKNGMGESWEDLADCVAQIAQTSKETDPSRLGELANNALTLRDTFGFDIPETMRAVNMLMDQFGMTGEEAFNLIAQGAQNGLNKNDDLLDSINEYSVHYKKVGLDAEEMFNSLANGTDAGTFSVDKLGDAVKEFSIRVVDGSDTTKGAFGQIGLNIQDMETAFLQGGDTAKTAFQNTVNAIMALDSPLERNTVGVSLFGTMWEDLGEEGIKALTNISGEADRTAETMKKVNEVQYSDIGSQLNSLARTIKTDLLEPVVSQMIPPLKEGVTWIVNNLPSISQALTDMLPVLAGIAAGFLAFKIADTVGEAAGAIKKMGGVMSALNAVMAANPIGFVVALIAGLVTAFVTLWNTSEEFRNFWIGLWETIKTGAITAFDAVFGFLTKTVPETIKSIVTFFSELPGKIWEWLKNALLKIIEWGAEMETKARNAVKDTILGIVNGFMELPGKLWDIGKNALEGFWDGLKSVGNRIKDWASNFFGGIIDKAKEVLRIHSPSVEFRQIAEYVMKGFNIGLDDGSRDVLKNTRKIFTGVVDTGKKALSNAAGTIMPEVETGGRAAGVIENNNSRSITVYQTNTSPKALSRLEIYRQTKNILGAVMA